jgi:hypothetical protein
LDSSSGRQLYIQYGMLCSSTYNKVQRYTIFFVAVSALHVSRGFSAHHQELKIQNCRHSIWYVSSLLAATASGSSKRWLYVEEYCNDAWPHERQKNGMLYKHRCGLLTHFPIIHQTAHTDACKTYHTAYTTVSLRMNRRGSKHVGDNIN